MKVLPRYWGYLLIFLVCGWLILFFSGRTGLIHCTGFVSGLSGCHQKAETIYKPIDITKAGQSVTFDFEIRQEGNYQFSLLFAKFAKFAKKRDYDEMNRRLKLFGSIYEDGVMTPVSLYLVKDGQIFFDKKINAGGSSWGSSFDYEGRTVTAAVREIKTLTLPLGHYSAVITILEDTPLLNGIESFVEFTYFNPKI